MKFKDRFAAARAESRLTQEALASQLGISAQSISQWELGKTTPRRQRIEALAKALNTNELWLASGTGSHVIDHRFDSPLEQEVRPIPELVLDEIKDWIKDGTQPQREDITHHYDMVNEGCFAVMTSTESMQPHLHLGDVCLIDPEIKPQPGNVVLAWIEEKKSFIYRKLSVDGSDFWLSVSNPDWPLKPYLLLDGDEISGVVIKTVRNLVKHK